MKSGFLSGSTVPNTALGNRTQAERSKQSHWKKQSGITVQGTYVGSWYGKGGRGRRDRKMFNEGHLGGSVG